MRALGEGGDRGQTDCQMQIKEMSAISADPMLLTVSYGRPRLLFSLPLDGFTHGRKIGKRVSVKKQMELKETPQVSQVHMFQLRPHAIR